MTDIEASGLPTLAHVGATLDPDGKGISRITDVLSKFNPILDDIPWYEGNLATGHQITLSANALPSVQWRRINRGVNKTLVETAQYTESCGVMEDRTDVDELLYELRGGAAYREKQENLKRKVLAQGLSTALFYSSTSSSPEEIHGLAPRFPATSGYSSSGQTLAGTNAGVNAHSIWIVTWGEGLVYGIYPNGTKAGYEDIDRGRVEAEDSDGKKFWALSTSHRWMCGFAIEDYRYAVRIQWDPDDAAMAADDKGLYLLLQQGLNVVREVGASTMIYMDRTSKTRLDSQLLSNEGRALEWLSKGGKRLQHFQGVPIRLEEALVAETAIS